MLHKGLSGKNILIGYVLCGIILCTSFGLDLWQGGIESWLTCILAKVITVVAAWSINQYLIKHKFISPNVLYPAFFVILVLCSIPNIEDHLVALISVVITIHIVRKLVLLYNQFETYKENFELGALVGCLFFVDSFYITLLLAIVISLSFIKTFEWRDVVVPFLGFGLILFVKFSFDYIVFQSFDAEFVQRLPKTFNAIIPEFERTHLAYVPLIALLVLTVLSTLRTLDSQTILTRIHNKIWLWILGAIVISSFFLVTNKNPQKLIIHIAAPIAFFGTNVFQSKQGKFFTNLLLYLLIITGAILRLNLIGIYT